MIRMSHGYAGIWEDTQEWVYGVLPGWLTWSIKIDVPEGRDGVNDLKAKFADLPDDQQVILSARAQYALWEIMRDEAAKIDFMMAESMDLPPDVGELLRAKLISMGNDLTARAKGLYKINDDAFRSGVPPAIRKDWAGVAVEQTGPEVAAIFTNPGFWVFATIAIATVVLATGYIISSSIQSSNSTGTMDKALEAALKLGRPDLIPGIVGQVPEIGKSQFPWGWVLGVGAAGVGAVLLLSWMSGELGEVVSKMKHGVSKRWPKRSTWDED